MGKYLVAVCLSLVIFVGTVVGTIAFVKSSENTRLRAEVARLNFDRVDREVAIASREGELALVRFEKVASSGKVEAVELLTFKIRGESGRTRPLSKGRLKTSFKWVIEATKLPVLLDGCRNGYALTAEIFPFPGKAGIVADISGTILAGSLVEDGQCAKAGK